MAAKVVFIIRSSAFNYNILIQKMLGAGCLKFLLGPPDL